MSGRDVIEGTAIEHLDAPDDSETFEIVAPLLDTRRLKSSIGKRQTNRDLIIDWIRGNLHAGIDFGQIHFVSKEKCPAGRRCQDLAHWSKPSLWKPGAEKICGMLAWVPRWPNLEDYTRLALEGKMIGTIVLRCNIYNADGVLVGEGIGARSVDADFGDLNKSLKMAKKSAHIDGVLVAAGLSEIFTQDYGDDLLPTGVDPYTPGAEPRANPYEYATTIDLETHCTIGKNWKGKPWSEVEESFLDFIISKIDDKPELVARAKREKVERSDSGAKSPPPPPAAESGSPDLAKHTKALCDAKDLVELQSAWKAVPQEFRKQLARTKDTLKTKLTKRSK